MPDDSSREENSSLDCGSTSVERATRRSKDHTKEKASRYQNETGLPLALQMERMKMTRAPLSKVLQSSFLFPFEFISLVSSILGTGLKMQKISKSFPLENTR